MSTQHAPGYFFHQGEGDEAKYTELRKYVLGVIADVLPAELLTANTVYHINPTGRFEIGGPDGDAGLTGRKIIVDTYGGARPHGGGAFSGKDPTKVDRSAALYHPLPRQEYRCRGPRAPTCTIQLSYAIGVAEPLSIYVDLHGTGTVEESRIEAGDPAARAPDAEGYPHPPRPQQADLQADRGLWPLRPHVGGRQLPVGTHRPRRQAQGGARQLSASLPLNVNLTAGRPTFVTLSRVRADLGRAGRSRRPARPSTAGRPLLVRV